MQVLAVTPKSQLSGPLLKEFNAVVSQHKREMMRPQIEEAARQYATAGFTPPSETPARQLVSRFTGGFGESLTFGLYQPRIEPPKATAEKVATYAGRVGGAIIPTMLSYGVVSPLFQGVKAATPLARVGVEGLRGITAGAAYGVGRAAVEVGTGKAAPAEIPRIVAEEAVIGSIGDFIVAGTRYLLDLRALRRMGTAVKPGAVDDGLRAVAKMAEKGRPPQEIASVLSTIPKSGDAEVDQGIDGMVRALLGQGEVPQVGKPFMQVEPAPELPARPKAAVKPEPPVQPGLPVAESPRVPRPEVPAVPGAEPPKVAGLPESLTARPKRAAPAASRKFGRGKRGSVTLAFENPVHAQLFDLWAQYNKAHRGEDIPLEDLVRQLAYWLNVPEEQVPRAMIRYRDAIREAIKDLPAGSTYKVPAPQFPGVASAVEPPKVPGVEPPKVPGAPDVPGVERLPAPARGSKATVKTERGTMVDTEYAVVSARDLVTSHDVNFQQDPRFPQELQPRMRERMTSQVQVARIENRLEPEFLAASPKASEGAPIIGPDLAVESGNARTIALKRLYQRNAPNAQAYRAWLIENADRFGLTKADIEAIPDPVLVRRRLTEVDRIRFVEEANEAAVSAMSATEQAVADSKKLTGELMALFVPDDEGNILTAANKSFMEAFLQAVVGPTELGRYVGSEGISQEGVRRVRNALFARAYGDVSAIERLAESVDDNVRNITNALVALAPRFADLSEQITRGARYDYDISGDIAAALRKFSALKEAGQTVDSYLVQGRLFGEELSDLGKDLLRVFDRFSRSRKKLVQILGSFVDGTHLAGDPRQQTFFELAKPTKAELLQAAIDKVEEAAKSAKTLQASLFEGATAGGQAARPPAPAAGAGAQGLVEEVIEKQYERAKPFLKGPEPPGVLPEPFRAGISMAPAPTPELERALTATRGPLSQLQAIAGRLKHYADSVADALVYHRDIADHPWLRNQTRLFEGSVQDASAKAIKALVGVTADASQADYELFRRLIVLSDLAYVAEQGKTLPKGVTAQAVNSYLQELMSQASPTIRDMIARHDELMRAVGLDLVRRGKLSPVSLQAAYFPHYVLDYLSDEANFPYLPRRLREPFRYYAKERVGSVKDIDTDYLNVMYRHLTKIFLDNATDDFAEAVARQYDMSAAIRAMGREPEPRVLYEIEGKHYVGWQYAPGNRIYPAVTPVEKAVADAIANEMTVEQFLAENIVRGPRGGVRLEPGGPLREIPALGGRKPVQVIPVEVARHLDSLRHRQLAKWAEPLADAMSVWKRMTLGFAGVPFQVNNLVGDLMNLYREDPGALLAFRDAWAAVVKGQAPADIPDLLEQAVKQRVRESGLIRSPVVPYLGEPSLARLQPLKAGLARYNPLSLYEQVSEIREDLPRMMKFITDMRRIREGRQVVAKSIDIAGLAPMEAAGKAAREFTVDYGKLTPEMKGARRLLFPFLTFYVENTKNWFNYVLKNPSDAAVKFGIPLGAVWLWNNTIQKNVEEKLPEYYRWMPHINTGYVTEDGKHIVISLQTPLDLAAQMVGLDKLPDKVTRVRAGEMTPSEAAKAQLGDMVRAPFEEAYQLLNPIAKAIIDIAANKDSFTGAAIVPQRLQGTAEGRRLQREYAAKQLVTPYAQYMRSQRELQPGDPFLQTLVSGPLDVKRAAGIREIDLSAAERQGTWQAIEEAETAARQRKHSLEEAYIAYLVTGSTDALTTLINQGVPVTANEMRSLAQNPRVRAEAVRRKLRLERDPQRRRALEEELRIWQQAQQIEAIKGVSIPERAGLLGGGP